MPTRRLGFSLVAVGVVLVLSFLGVGVLPPKLPGPDPRPVSSVRLLLDDGALAGLAYLPVSAAEARVSAFISVATSAPVRQEIAGRLGVPPNEVRLDGARDDAREKAAYELGINPIGRTDLVELDAQASTPDRSSAALQAFADTLRGSRGPSADEGSYASLAVVGNITTEAVPRPRAGVVSSVVKALVAGLLAWICVGVAPDVRTFLGALRRDAAPDPAH